MRVLLADDSRVMRKIIIRTLRQAGYDWQIEQAEDGAQALAMVLEREPDLVISDWNMPNLTGVELLRTLRLRGYRTPFCFVTSEGSEEMRDAGRRRRRVRPDRQAVHRRIGPRGPRPGGLVSRR